MPRECRFFYGGVFMFNAGKKNNQTEKTLTSVIDAFDAEIAIVRNGNCSMLAMNEPARARIDPEEHSLTNCKRGYSCFFPQLCDVCTQRGSDPVTADIRDEDGRVYAVTRNTVEWTDGKTATSLVLRDVDEERGAKQKMYNLAYIDQLTGVPNRTKLKEDFEMMVPEIRQKKLSGIVAIFDLDNFKTINDTYGHNTGDAMLQRLTTHLLSEEDFRGHIYRLGGDEFVLLYKNSPGRFSSFDEMREYYMTLLKKTLLNYTMPNIEDRCTLSMGVSFFPEHGNNLSELLRRADIALYRAKAGGRKRIVLFEEDFDEAKQFKDMYINIQPILLKNGNTYGYELVDSDRPDETDAGMVSLSEFDRTLDALGLNDIRDGSKYFISFTKQLFNQAALKHLPKDKFVIQIYSARNVPREQIALYKQLHDYGYSLALVNLDRENLDKELIGLADYCRFNPTTMGPAEQARIISAYPDKTYIASEISSNEEFMAAQKRGFNLFEGYYFNKEIVVKKEKDIEPLKVNYFRLLQLTSTDDYVDFDEIASVISSDVALSYKLLRLLNSASVGLRTRVSSIFMAVTLLGEENLKKWISVLALRGVADEKPLELVRLSLIRAHFGEQLATSFQPPKDARHIFMTGLLSLLHIALDKSQEELLEEIPVADEIRDSLLTDEGPYSELLRFFRNYEYSNWEEITKFSRKNGISGEVINEAYINSVKWCTDLIGASN